jgi:hypothetical protein
VVEILPFLVVRRPGLARAVMRSFRLVQVLLAALYASALAVAMLLVVNLASQVGQVLRVQVALLLLLHQTRKQAVKVGTLSSVAAVPPLVRPEVSLWHRALRRVAPQVL